MFTLDPVSLAVLSGVGFLGLSLAPVLRLLQITRSRHLRRAWLWLSVMIIGFIIGYLALIGLLPRDINRTILSLLCTVLVMGSVFVLSVAILALRTARDVARLVHLEQEVIVDPLTGVYNRRFFDEQIEREVALAGRAGTDLGLLVIDVDHFKEVNDAFGHTIGDRVLAVIATVLNEEIRRSDIPVRYGGDEFVIIAPASGSEAVADLAKRLCRKVGTTHVTCPGGKKISLTVSIGFATMLENETAESLFMRSDAAVYEAKSAGRNLAVSGDLGSEQPSARMSVM